MAELDTICSANNNNLDNLIINSSNNSSDGTPGAGEAFMSSTNDAKSLVGHGEINTANKAISSKFQLSCPTCGLYQRTKATLNAHITNFHMPKNFSCSLCTYKTSKLPLLKRHERKISLCKLCDFKTCKTLDYQKHLSNHNAQKALAKSKQAAEEPKSNTRIKCKECKFTSAKEEVMLHHVRKMHCGEDAHQCNKCEYTTNDSASYEKHMHSHLGFRPYKCSYCDYRGGSEYYLKKHEITHHTKSNFTCHVCNKTYWNIICFKDHLRKNHNKIDIPQETELGKNVPDIDCTEQTSTTSLKPRYGQKDEKISFNCALCNWSSDKLSCTLLHLIHHPNQKINEEIIDISILRKFHIMK